MKLNTDIILESIGDSAATSGITFHRISSPEEWGDNTTDRSLHGFEVDRNFYNLKAEDIKGARWDDENNKIILETWGRGEINIGLPFNEKMELMFNYFTEKIDNIDLGQW